MTRSILHLELLIRVLYSGDDILRLLTWYRSVSLVQPKIILNRHMPPRQSPIYFTMVHGFYTYPFPSIPLVSCPSLSACYTVMLKLTEYEPHPGNGPVLAFCSLTRFYHAFFLGTLPAVLMVGQGVPS